MFLGGIEAWGRSERFLGEMHEMGSGVFFC